MLTFPSIEFCLEFFYSFYIMQNGLFNRFSRCHKSLKFFIYSCIVLINQLCSLIIEIYDLKNNCCAVFDKVKNIQDIM